MFKIKKPTIKDLSIKTIFVFSSLFLFNCKVIYKSFYTDPEKCFTDATIKKPYDVVIIPGFPHDSGKVNGMVSERIKWGYYLYKNNYAKNIIFSGSAVYSPYIEAEVMRLFALQIGIKDENIFTETKAEHTTENVYYSTVLAKSLGFTNIAFATQTAQSSFMKPFRRKFKLDFDFLPIVYDSLRLVELQIKPINESLVYIPNFVSLKEKEGFFKRLRGTRGHKVKVAMRKAKRLKRQQNK